MDVDQVQLEAHLHDCTLPQDTPPRRDMLLFFCLPFFAAVILTFASTPDDVFITLRYAANIVHGHGLVFNPGEHVQGFTSPLDLLVAIVVYLIPGGLALFKMKLASVLFGLLAIREAGTLLWRLPLPPWALRVGGVTIGTCSVIAYSSGNGLETSLEMWLLIAIARRLILDDRRRSTMAIAVLAFGAVLARPDAVAPLTCMAIAGLYIQRDIGLIRRSSWFAGVVIAASMTIIGEVIYFKSILPNTFYAKNVPIDRSLAQGWQYLHYLLQPVGFDSLFSQPILVNLVTIIEAIFLALGTLSIMRKHSRCTYLLALIVGQVLFVLKSGGDWMAGGRFLAAAAIPVIVIEVIGAIEAATFLRHHLSARSERYPVAVTSLLLMSTSMLPLSYVNAPIWLISGASDGSS
jgi:arabinofuranosyltransferase